MKLLPVFLLTALLLCGCRKEATAAPCRVVTKVEITASQNGSIENWVYTSPRKIDLFLYYLHDLRTGISSQVDADTFRADAYRITLFFSDGSHAVYYQIFDQFLRHNDGPWRKIHGAKGSRLQALLLSMAGED